MTTYVFREKVQNVEGSYRYNVNNYITELVCNILQIILLYQ